MTGDFANMVIDALEFTRDNDPELTEDERAEHTAAVDRILRRAKRARHKRNAELKAASFRNPRHEAKVSSPVEVSPYVVGGYHAGRARLSSPA